MFGSNLLQSSNSDNYVGMRILILAAWSLNIVIVSNSLEQGLEEGDEVIAGSHSGLKCSIS